MNLAGRYVPRYRLHRLISTCRHPATRCRARFSRRRRRTQRLDPIRIRQLRRSSRRRNRPRRSPRTARCSASSIRRHPLRRNSRNSCLPVFQRRRLTAHRGRARLRATPSPSARPEIRCGRFLQRRSRYNPGVPEPGAWTDVKLSLWSFPFCSKAGQMATDHGIASPFERQPYY